MPGNAAHGRAEVRLDEDVVGLELRERRPQLLERNVLVAHDLDAVGDPVRQAAAHRERDRQRALAFLALG